MHIVGLEEYQDLVNLFEDCRSGQLPRKPFMNGATPSYHDPTQAPPGKATAFMWQLMTYNLWGNPLNWDKVARRVVLQAARGLAEICAQSRREQYSLDRFDHAARHRAPRSQHVLRRLDGRRVFRRSGAGEPAVSRLGSIPHADRRACSCAARRAIPGGNITGAPGYNAARVIAESLGMKPWWKPVDFREHLKGLG